MVGLLLVELVNIIVNAVESVRIHSEIILGLKESLLVKSCLRLGIEDIKRVAGYCSHQERSQYCSIFFHIRDLHLLECNIDTEHKGLLPRIVHLVACTGVVIVPPE